MSVRENRPFLSTVKTRPRLCPPRSVAFARHAVSDATSLASFAFALLFRNVRDARVG